MIYCLTNCMLMRCIALLRRMINILMNLTLKRRRGLNTLDYRCIGRDWIFVGTHDNSSSTAKADMLIIGGFKYRLFKPSANALSGVRRVRAITVETELREIAWTVPSFMF